MANEKRNQTGQGRMDQASGEKGAQGRSAGNQTEESSNEQATERREMAAGQPRAAQGESGGRPRKGGHANQATEGEERAPQSSDTDSGLEDEGTSRQRQSQGTPGQGGRTGKATDDSEMEDAERQPQRGEDGDIERDEEPRRR